MQISPLLSHVARVTLDFHPAQNFSKPIQLCDTFLNINTFSSHFLNSFLHHWPNHIVACIPSQVLIRFCASSKVQAHWFYGSSEHLLAEVNMMLIQKNVIILQMWQISSFSTLRGWF